MNWLATEPGIWRSADGRYAIVAQALPENPPRTVYQARKVDEAMARAYPERGDLGYLLEESPWCWNEDNSVHSAEAVIERDAFTSAHDTSVPEDHPAAALSRFWWPISKGTSRGALAVTVRDGEVVAQVLGMARHDDSGFEPEPWTEISLTGLGLVPAPGAAISVTTDHGPEPCPNCGAKVGDPHDAMCSIARCEVTGGQRLMCTYFGGSPLAGMEALSTGRQAEFEDYFKTPAGHDCGQDAWQGDD